ncbi:MAG: hypothetical protein QXY39_01755 [Thermofilaceae archaeon]
MSIPIVRQYESLSEKDKARVKEQASKCNASQLAELLTQILGRQVNEKEARYLMLELNPECAKPASQRIDVQRYYEPVDLQREIDFIYNFEKERLLVARQVEIENGNIPLSITDRIVEVLVKIIELKVKHMPGANPLEELARMLEESQAE